MKIGDAIGVSLIDYPGHIAATLFAQGCPWRCPYCHNPELVFPERFGGSLSQEAVYRFLAQRRSDIDAVVLSGGEVTLYRDLGEWIRNLHLLGFKVKVDTNGCFPDRLLRMLAENPPDYIAMDIKADPEGYDKMVGKRGAIAHVRDSIRYLLASGVAHEFRTTVVEEYHLPTRLERMYSLVPKMSPYFLQGFVPSTKIDGPWRVYPATRPEYLALAERLARVAGLDVSIRGLGSGKPG